MCLGLIATIARVGGLIGRSVHCLHVLCLQLIDRVVADVLADQIELHLVGLPRIFIAKF
jgi:hypothetical protein